jgi:hypothetical protein
MHLPQDVLNMIIGLGIIVGAIQCFFGYRIFKFILGLTGFILGGAICAAIGYAIFQKEVIALLAGLVGGIIGAALIVVLYLIGIFLIGAFLGGVLGTALFAVAGHNPEPAVILILAVIVGVIALIFQKFMIIVSTGFWGAWSVVMGIAYFTTGAVDPTSIERFFRSGGGQLYAILLCWIVLGIVGVIVQFKSAPVKEK